MDAPTHPSSVRRPLGTEKSIAPGVRRRRSLAGALSMEWRPLRAPSVCAAQMDPAQLACKNRRSPLFNLRVSGCLSDAQGRVRRVVQRSGRRPPVSLVPAISESARQQDH
jgi:hypothetical protein